MLKMFQYLVLHYLYIFFCQFNSQLYQHLHICWGKELWSTFALFVRLSKNHHFLYFSQISLYSTNNTLSWETDKMDTLFFLLGAQAHFWLCIQHVHSHFYWQTQWSYMLRSYWFFFFRSLTNKIIAHIGNIFTPTK